MPSIVITGAQWGDEGKGKLVDALSQSAQVVVRFQGGHNAGHTLVVGGVKTKLQLTPCGILRPETTCLIAAGVVANPRTVLAEIETLRSRGVEISPSRLVIDRDCQLVLDYHPILDKAREDLLGDEKIGTTGLGIGPAYEDRAGRRGVRFGDLLDLDSLRPRLEVLVAEKNLMLEHVLSSKLRVDFPSVWSTVTLAAEQLLPFVGNASIMVTNALKRGERVVFEGAQATLLDVTFGTVPFVTSSSTIAGAVLTGCGIGPSAIDHVLGVAKAYTTRVGSGPFPTEIHDAMGEHIRTRGGEFGTVTGRPRRCGWLDAFALRRAIRLNGYSSLAIMKLDVLSGISPLKICTGYRIDGKLIEDFPALNSELAKIVPEYVECPGWEDDLTNLRKFEDLPANAQKYVQLVESIVECPVSLVSVGPDRIESILTPNGRYLQQFSAA